MRRSSAILTFSLIALLFPARLFALDPTRVLIVHADNAADRELANYYALKRGVPADHILAVSIHVPRFYLCGDYSVFQNDLIKPIKLKLAQLGPTAIDVILLAGPIPSGVSSARSCAGGYLEPVSVDNALMGLNYWDPATNNIIRDTNSYFDPTPSFTLEKGPFNHATFKFHGTEMYLVSRLGSQTALAGLEEIDQALYADRYLSPLPGYYNGYAYVDSRSAVYTDAYLSASDSVQKGLYTSYDSADENIAYSEHFIKASGFPLKWENTAGSISIGAPGATWSDGTPALTAPRPLFYGGWYNPCCFADVFDWLPGSVVTDLNSGPFFALYNGLARGASAVAYVIGEPFLDGIQRPHTLYYYILNGYSFAEASTLSTPDIGWMETNEGDPLYAPTRNRPLIHDTQSPVLSAGYPYDSLGAGPTDRVIHVMVDDSPEPEVVQVKVEYGTTLAYGNTADSWKGYWRRPAVTLSNLQANTLYHYRLTLTDPVGNVTTTTRDYTFHTGAAPPPPPTSPLSTPPPGTPLPPDTTPPTVGITYPIANSTLFGLSTISGTAADNRGVYQVTISVDGSIVGSAVGTTAWTFSLDTSLVGDGPHTLRAEVTDGSNNAGSTTLPITVNNAGKAFYDSDLKVPRCSDAISNCDSHVLLNGRGRMTGGIELHQPNTLPGADFCSEKSVGAYHFHESLDQLRVSTLDGAPFAAGKTVAVEATVWARLTSDHLDLWYAPDAHSPSWTFIATLTPTGSGSNTLSATYTLPSGYLQAIRGVFRSDGVPGVCSTGDFDDTDDLVFAVGPLPPPSGTATWITLDTTTQGTWKGTYGADGYAINSDVTSYPGYAQVAITNSLSYVWNQSTQDPRALQKGQAGDRIASTWYSADAFTIDLNLTDGVAHHVALYAVDWDDNNFRTQTVEVRDSLGTLLDRRNVATFGNGQYLVWKLSGHVRIKFINTGPNAVNSGVFFGPADSGPPVPPSPPPPSSAGATFVTLDVTTTGTWKGTYGTDGYAIDSNVTNHYPSYAQVTISNALSYIWNPSTQDTRALQKGNASDRIASTWYSSGAFTIDLNLTDGAAHQVAFYAVDWDDYTRSQVVEVRDTVGTLLDSRTLSTFRNGQYLVWNLSGHVQITVINTGSNAVISGIFFGGAVPPPSSGSATFIKLDTATQGTWQGTYGAEGFSIHSDVTSYPAYAQVTIGNALDYVWNPSTSDPRALQKSNASDRIASTWYTAGTFTIDLNLTDGAAHQVALYAVDWDDSNGRTQTVEVQDMNGTLLDSRALNTFSNGHYLVWTLSGHVRIRVINTGFNAVISGIFFGVS